MPELSNEEHAGYLDKVLPTGRHKTMLAKKSIWVFYNSELGIDSEKDRMIREFLGHDAWYGSGVDSTNGERDNSFNWSAAIEKKAVHLKRVGAIDRIQILETT